MAQQTNQRDLRPIIASAQQWIHKCLINDGSVFAGASLWTLALADEVEDAFVNHPIEGKEAFPSKLRQQMQNATPPAQKLMAEMIWILLLFPAKKITPANKLQQIRELWMLSGDPLPDHLPQLSETMLAGVGSGGTGYNTHRWRELTFLIQLVRNLKSLPTAEREKLFVDYNAFCTWIDTVDHDGDRQFRHMLRYFAFPDRVERMSSNTHRFQILEAFGVAPQKQTRSWSDRQLDDALLNLRAELAAKHPNEKLDFYEPPLRDMWWQAGDEDKPASASQADALHEGPAKALAAPFNKLFSSFEEAEWAFEFIRELLAKLGITTDDPRVALTLPKSQKFIRLNFCQWVITSFFNESRSPDRTEISLLDGLVNLTKNGTFTTRKGEPVTCVFGLPTEKLRNMEPALQAAIDKSMPAIAGRFTKQSKSGYRKKNQPKLMEMVFDPVIRKERLHSGFTPEVESADYWIFQGSPDHFDVDAYLASQDQILWSVRQHPDDIHSGDRVLLWRSGANAGVVAVCSVETDPTLQPDDAPDKWKKPSGELDLRCRLTIEQRFIDNPITREAIKAALPTLNIIRQPAGTNFPISESDFTKILSLKDTSMSTQADLPIARNLILFGPPGTGKTFALRERFMKLFTDREVVLTREDQLTALAKDLSWWEVIALALLDTKDNRGSVAQILSHPLVAARLKLSANKNPRAMIWASLQTHTKADCQHVNYTSRIEPQLFSKDADSIWSIDAALAYSVTPDFSKWLTAYRNPGQQPASVTRRYRFTTFHQSFSYEDFIEGIKPQMEDRDDGQLAYEIRDGVFKEICQEAAASPAKPYALFIDEINRGNVASIFGELITLIEDDKRLGAANELKATLPYSREEFGVPANLYIIGTMNTADRSVEALDTALRRRFIFEEMRPDSKLVPDSQDFGVNLPKLFTVLNARLEQLLDHDHCIGHAYFMGIKDIEGLRQAFANKIIPLLREYFYGNPAKIGMVLGERFISRQADPISFAAGEWGVDDQDEKAVYQFADVSGLNAADFASIYA